MSGYRDKADSLLKLEAWLSKYDKVFFVQGNAGFEMLSILLNSQAFFNYQGAVLFLLPDNEEEWNCVYVNVSQAEADWLGQLYYTYEFSDKFKVMRKDNRFGELQNYYETGLMTKEQVCEALLR